MNILGTVLANVMHLGWCGNWQPKFQLYLQVTVQSNDDQSAQCDAPFHIVLVV